MSAPNFAKRKRMEQAKDSSPDQKYFSAEKSFSPASHRRAPDLRSYASHPPSPLVKSEISRGFTNPLLTEAVHLSHFEYKTFKVLRKCPTLSHPRKKILQSRVRIVSASFFGIFCKMGSDFLKQKPQ